MNEVFSKIWCSDDKYKEFEVSKVYNYDQIIISSKRSMKNCLANSTIETSRQRAITAEKYFPRRIIWLVTTVRA